jgi:hypothetical protein
MSVADTVRRDALGVKLVRADFSNDEIWNEIQADTAEPNDAGYRAMLTVLEDRDLDGLGGHDLTSAIRRLYGEAEAGVIFVADTMTMSTPEHSVLVIDQSGSRWPFRALAITICDIEANVSIGNLDIGDYARGADPDGTFRGFDRQPEPLDPDRPDGFGGQAVQPQPLELSKRLRWVEERNDERHHGGPPAGWNPPPPPIPREARGRAFTTPEAWLVIVYGNPAQSGRARAAGPFATYREAVHFHHRVVVAKSARNVEVIRLEDGCFVTPFVI